MTALIFLIPFPLGISLLALLLPYVVPGNTVIGTIANAVMCGVPVYMLFRTLDQGSSYSRVDSGLVDGAMLLGKVLMAAYVIRLSIRAIRVLPIILTVTQLAVMLGFELTSGHSIRVEHSLFMDKFSLIMALVVGVSGSSICLYGFGYLQEYHEHFPEVKDRRGYCAFLMYLFLSAMFGLVFSNSLAWLFFFWEITAVCSFLLIGYLGDRASRDSAFRALNMNLVLRVGPVMHNTVADN